MWQDLKSYENFEKKLLNESEDIKVLLEMSGFRKSDTNLPVNIWIDDVGAERKTSHNLPRIKFQNDTSDNLKSRDTIPMSISDNPEVLINNFQTKLSQSDITKIKKFIIDNYDALMDYWNGKITLVQFVCRMKPYQK